MKKRQFRVWILTDYNGKELARGRKRDVEKVAYVRYVYEGIYSDCIFCTNEWC